MKTVRTPAIVLARIDYGEADRIITFLTPKHGKLRLMAKGVRRVKSKLAGGIELFSTSDISFIKGKGDIGTLVSTQLIKHYGHIIKDINRVQLGYDLIKNLHKATEDNAEEEYYYLLEDIFVALNDVRLDVELIKLWFYAQMLALNGHTPNMQTDASGNKLEADSSYNFDFESVAFNKNETGRFNASHIKTMRLLFSQNKPLQLAGVAGFSEKLETVKPLINTLQKTYS